MSVAHYVAMRRLPWSPGAPAAWHGEAAEREFDRFDLQRHLVTLEHVQTQAVQNKRDLEGATENDRRAYRTVMKERMKNPNARRDLLMRIAMFNAPNRAKEPD